MIVRIHFRFLIFFFITDWRLYCNQYKVVLTCISICQSQQLGKKIHLGKFEKKENSSVKVCRSSPDTLIS